MRKSGNPGSSTVIGRDEILADVGELLQAERLVTLTGPGGVGKSALAAELARRTDPAGWRAVGRTDLGPLADPGLVPHWLARALRLDGDPARPQLAALADAVGGSRVLLVVDTCEHLAESCAKSFTELVAECPGLHVLATSRTAMDTPGRRIGPMALDDAVGLFEAVVRRLRPTEEVAPGMVRHICALCDGLPLAVRIAAEQLGSRPPADVLSLVSRPEDALDLTASAPTPGLPARQRTLRASLQWSLRLCTAAERLLWARCSVFPSDFRLADALEVCGDERLPPGPLAAAFTGLGRQALVVPAPREADGSAFRMPRDSRAYGRQWLTRLGEDREFLRRCLLWSLRAT